ncbi:uncharacterized protein K452DRAFT_279995, partial [Aplosporella prunicola CBS 121167]
MCESCGKPLTDFDAVNRIVVNRTSEQICPKPLSSSIGDKDIYRYHQLEEDQIRLIALHPAEFHAELHCTIVRVSLNNLPPFEAVSYTWANQSGDSTSQGHVLLGRARKSLPVTVNCEAVLRRLRLPNMNRLLWIDAICINQTSKFTQERNHQVALMSRIYREAHTVLVYLGESTQSSNRLFEYLAMDEKQMRGLRSLRNDTMPSGICNDLSLLLRRPWFSRIWVLQEAAVARRCNFICGTVFLDYNHLFLAVSWLLKSSPGSSKPCIFDLRNEHTINETLWDVLQSSQSCLCSEPQDRIYALRGIVRDIRSDELLPDYTKSAEEVFVDVAKHLVRTYRSPNVLFLRTHRLRTPFPSWVPDF